MTESYTYMRTCQQCKRQYTALEDEIGILCPDCAGKPNIIRADMDEKSQMIDDEVKSYSRWRV